MSDATGGHPLEQLSAYLDDELPVEDRAPIPAFGGEVLVRDEAPRCPTRLPASGELPYETALRALSEMLNIEASINSLVPVGYGGVFVPPLAVETLEQPHFQQITFCYLVALSERLPAPEHWEWMPCSEAPLPPAVIEACIETQVMQKS